MYIYIYIWKVVSIYISSCRNSFAASCKLNLRIVANFMLLLFITAIWYLCQLQTTWHDWNTFQEDICKLKRKLKVSIDSLGCILILYFNFVQILTTFLSLGSLSCYNLAFSGAAKNCFSTCNCNSISASAKKRDIPYRLKDYSLLLAVLEDILPWNASNCS